MDLIDGGDGSAGTVAFELWGAFADGVTTKIGSRSFDPAVDR